MGLKVMSAMLEFCGVPPLYVTAGFPGGGFFPVGYVGVEVWSKAVPPLTGFRII